MSTTYPVVVTLRFSLTPQPVVLKAGERLRLDIGSRTDLLVSNVSQGRAQFQMQVPPYFSRNTLHYGAESYIELMRVRIEPQPRQGDCHEWGGRAVVFNSETLR